MTSTDRESLKTTIKTLEQFRLGNDRDVLLLSLAVSYLEVLRLARPGVIVRWNSDGATREFEGSLEFSTPLDAPACVGIVTSQTGIVAVGDEVEIIASEAHGATY